MQISLSVGSMLGLFGAMIILAFMPSVSVLAVTARAAASGFGHGACTAVGVVAGDVVFIAVAILGLSLLVEALGDLFVLVKYLGGAWLIWLGIDLWRSRRRESGAEQQVDSSWLSSFMTGLLITLADQKAILFYLGFFPAFINLSRITTLDASLVIAIMIVAVGGPKLVYAWAAARGTGLLVEGRMGQWVRRLAAGVLLGVGVFLIVGA